MVAKNLPRLQAVVKFVVAWLIGLYLFELVKDGQHWAGGIGAVVVAIFVNVYARKKAAAVVNTTPVFYIWLYLPVVVLFVLPVVIKIALMFTGKDDQTWWNHLASVLPFLLKLGVPVAALIGVYVALGRLVKREAALPEAND